MDSDGHNLKNLSQEELEERVREVILAHRCSIDETQALHDRLLQAPPQKQADIRRAYEEAVRRHDTQHMVLCQYLDLLGYIPKFGGNA